jgi:phosphoesterase RecJ-like protein
MCWTLSINWAMGNLVDLPMAKCLYAGIMTDTGSFRHGNTTPEVHLAVAELMKTGLNVNYVHRAIFDNNSIGRTRLLGYALSEKLTAFYPSIVRFIWCYLWMT